MNGRARTYIWNVWKLSLVAVAALAGQARANVACTGETGWSPTGAEVPPHAHLVFWSNAKSDGNFGTLTATIDGKVVATNVRTLRDKPNTMHLIEVDSTATGKLELRWGKADAATFTVVAKPTYAKTAHATTSRYHRELRHTSVREVFDGLAIKLDVPATRAHIKSRRDASASWVEMDVPVDSDHTIRLGELGCAQNYNPQLLENGIDLVVTVVMPDNTTLPVAELSPAQIPKLP